MIDITITNQKCNNIDIYILIINLITKNPNNHSIISINQNSKFSNQQDRNLARQQLARQEFSKAATLAT
jgi:hypothetical protein